VLPQYDEETTDDELIPYDGSSVRVRNVEKLRLLSRFPQGLTQPLLDEILEAEGQSTVDVIGSK